MVIKQFNKKNNLLDPKKSQFIIDNIKQYIKEKSFPKHLLISNLNLKIKENQTNIERINKILNENKNTIANIEKEIRDKRLANKNEIINLRKNL